jgi:hypothetical protein
MRQLLHHRCETRTRQDSSRRMDLRFASFGLAPRLSGTRQTSEAILALVWSSDAKTRDPPLARPSTLADKGVTSHSKVAPLVNPSCRCDLHHPARPAIRFDIANSSNASNPRRERSTHVEHIKAEFTRSKETSLQPSPTSSYKRVHALILLLQSFATSRPNENNKMAPARPLKRARQRSSPSDNRDHDQSRPVRRRRIDRSKEVSTATASTTTMSTAALRQSERTTISRQAGHSRLNKRTGKYSKARPVTLRPIAKVHDDASSDDGDDENELELAGLETDLLPPSSPAYGQKLPVQATFPKGRTLEGLARKLDLPPTVAPIRSLPSPQLTLNLPPLNFDLNLKHNTNFPRPSLPTQAPSHTNLHLNRSFSTPRKISGSHSFAGETTEEEQESGDENGSDILSEIEEENREYYKEMQERQRQLQVIGKGKGIERVSQMTRVCNSCMGPG